MLKKRENRESGYFLNCNFVTRVSVKRGIGIGAGPGVYPFFFFLNAVLGLGLASTLTLTLTVKQIALQMSRPSPTSSPGLKGKALGTRLDLRVDQMTTSNGGPVSSKDVKIVSSISTFVLTTLI